MKHFLGSVGVRGSVRGPFFTRHRDGCLGGMGVPVHVTLKLTQRGQASVTLQPDSGLFNWLGAGVVKLTV